MFGKKERPKQVETAHEEIKPKFKPFDPDDYKAKCLTAKYEIQVKLRVGKTLKIIRLAFAVPEYNPCHSLDPIKFQKYPCPANKFDLLGDLKRILKEIRQEGLFLKASDVDPDDKSSPFDAGQFIPPDNIVGFAYRKIEEA